MGETNGNHRSIFSMRSTAAPPPSRVPRGRTKMAKSIAIFLVAVMAVAAMALASVAGTGLAQAQTNTPTDRDALVTLYNATSGGGWGNNTNWLNDKPLGEWHGVTTDSDGRVQEAGSQRLSGEVPSELGSLSNLERLDLSGNQLSEVPSELGSPLQPDTLVPLRQPVERGAAGTGQPLQPGNVVAPAQPAERYRRNWAASPTWSGCISAAIS